ncbi:MarR family winged helix-turn-helix transcriptional regulator [Sulfoacidibacillus ferrooxidans]|uniref:HTH marR-type domain-containing protein n=1 Tax=Sulfoacidibacillus ferrooxidans TaxID=2005001 RepID=A0A9X2AEL0_9BACL|nr:hypothetical protein [Sulfoacidibacillus ferrooxidans]
MSLNVMNDDVVKIETLLRNVSSTIRKQGRAILGDFDMSPAQFDALIWVDEYKHITIGELSAKLGLAYSTTTDLVDRIERRGFVERMRDDQDKRVVRVRVLDPGLALIDRVLQERRNYLAVILGQLQVSEQMLILNALTILQQRLSPE